LSITSAARSVRLRERPCATPASVFIEHGTTAMPPQRWLPLAIVAPMSRLLCRVIEPARTPAPQCRRVVHHALDGRSLTQLVAQQPPSVVGHDELDRDTARQECRERPRGVDRALAPVIASAIDRRASADIHRYGQHEQIQDADVAVQIERALDLRQIVARTSDCSYTSSPATTVTPAKIDGRERRDEATAAAGKTIVITCMTREMTSAASRRSGPGSIAGRGTIEIDVLTRIRARRSRRPT